MKATDQILHSSYHPAATAMMKKANQKVVKAVTAAEVFNNCELVTEVPRHMREWNTENFVGFKKGNGDLVWVNIVHIHSIEFAEGTE